MVDYDLAYDLPDGVRVQVAVRAGSEPVVTPAGAVAWTVPKLFDDVERWLHQPGVAPAVTYDADLGYVVDLRAEHSCSETYDRVMAIEVAPLR